MPNYPHTLSAEEALEQYGFVKNEQDWYIKPNSPVLEAWKKNSNGWIYVSTEARAMPMANNAPAGTQPLPFGKPIADWPGYVVQPYKQIAVDASGDAISPSTHPHMYDWNWPDDYVAYVHEVGFRQTVKGENLQKVHDNTKDAPKIVKEKE